MRAWCWLLLGACYGPHAETGAPCQPKQPACPAGQMCVLRGDEYVCDVGPGAVTPDSPRPLDAPPSPPDAPVYDGSPADLDGDGIANLADNCPTEPNPDQYNEDGDKFGDACDPCPSVADDAPADGDNDGVADACDPHPSTPGDKIVLFEGFHAAPPATWSQFGTWTVGGGAISVDATAGRASLTLPGPTTGHVTVATSVTVDGLASASDASIGVLDAYDHTVAPRKGVFCHLTQWATSTPLAVVPLHDAPEHDAPYEITVGKAYMLAQIHDDTSYTCIAERGATQQTVTTDSALAPTVPEVGLRVNHAAATFAWIMVISNP